MAFAVVASDDIFSPSMRQPLALRLKARDKARGVSGGLDHASRMMRHGRQRAITLAGGCIFGARSEWRSR